MAPVNLILCLKKKAHLKNTTYGRLFLRDITSVVSANLATVIPKKNSLRGLRKLKKRLATTPLCKRIEQLLRIIFVIFKGSIVYENRIFTFQNARKCLASRGFAPGPHKGAREQVLTFS